MLLKPVLFETCVYGVPKCERQDLISFAQEASSVRSSSAVSSRCISEASSGATMINQTIEATRHVKIGLNSSRPAFTCSIKFHIIVQKHPPDDSWYSCFQKTWRLYPHGQPAKVVLLPFPIGLALTQRSTGVEWRHFFPPGLREVDCLVVLWILCRRGCLFKPI